MGEIFRDFGLTSASIQAPELTRGQRDNLFWINAGIGAALSLVLFALAQPLASLTSQPEIVQMTQWLSALFLLNGLATQHRANLMRDLNPAPRDHRRVGGGHGTRRRDHRGSRGRRLLGARPAG